MREFIEELKHNQNINFENEIENRIDIDYVIERLEGIDNELIDLLDYFKYHNKNLTCQQDDKINEIRESLESKGVFENE